MIKRFEDFNVSESYYGDCPLGGEVGILVSTEELKKYAAFVGSKSLDEYIPLPHKDQKKLKELIKTCKLHEGKNAYKHVEYWENEDDGGHGWCCDTCGTVTQWG